MHKSSAYRLPFDLFWLVSFMKIFVLQSAPAEASFSVGRHQHIVKELLSNEKIEQQQNKTKWLNQLFQRQQLQQRQLPIALQKFFNKQ